MRFPPRNKVSAFREREENLRKARLSSQTLRDAAPEASLVDVQLAFLPATAPPHAAQTFQLYPPARAFFSYPCPYGDCDGIYDLSVEAARVLVREKVSVAGTVECVGSRSRDGLQGQTCGLRMTYSISAQHEPKSAGPVAKASPVAKSEAKRR